MITFSLKTDNAAFEDDYRDSEIADILKDLASKIEQGSRPTVLHDTNGGAVGTVRYTGKDK